MENKYIKEMDIIEIITKKRGNTRGIGNIQVRYIMKKKIGNIQVIGT